MIKTSAPSLVTLSQSVKQDDASSVQMVEGDNENKLPSLRQQIQKFCRVAWGKRPTELCPAWILSPTIPYGGGENPESRGQPQTDVIGFNPIRWTPHLPDPCASVWIKLEFFVLFDTSVTCMMSIIIEHHNSDLRLHVLCMCMAK